LQRSADVLPAVSLPVELTPWLYLSDEKHARDIAKLNELGITHVLSVLELPPARKNFMSEEYAAWDIDHKHVSLFLFFFLFLHF
jgi:predicted nucleic acid-binding protein